MRKPQHTTPGAHHAAHIFCCVQTQDFRERKGFQTELNVWGRPLPPVDGNQAVLALTNWLQQACVMPTTEARVCAQFLFADGCRTKEDVFLLAEANALPAQLSKVTRLKIERARVGV